ncbi:MAG: FAD-binding protein [Chloroflexi bacterium]|nr:FAD-binding protein [Chloroflexota bacterium]
MKPNAQKSLEKLLGKDQVTTRPVELITYETDAGIDRGKPEAVAFPQSPDDVVRLARWASEHNVALIGRGAGTGLSGGAVAEHGGVIVAFARMNRVTEFDLIGRSAVVEPGTLNLGLDALAKQNGLYFPPDPASQRASSIGGNVAENAGGPHCFKYGVTTNYVTGMNIVLADGRAIRLGGRALDYPEYDLVGLLVGSEGTLALITSIDLRMIPNPPGIKTMMATFDSVPQAGDAVSALIAAGLVPATMEMMDRKIAGIIEEAMHVGLSLDVAATIIVEADGYPASLDAQIEEMADLLQAKGARSLRIAQSNEERDRLWYARKSAAGAMARLAPEHYTVDITVPRSQLADTLREVDAVVNKHALTTGYLLHAGDGNFHPMILVMNPHDQNEKDRIANAGREIAQIGVSRNGSITGEHGVGIEKREFMPIMHNDAELLAMWDVKQVFDPRGLLNPGKIFPTQMPQSFSPHRDGALPGDVFTPASSEEAARGIAALADAGRKIAIQNSEFRIQNSEFTTLSTSNLTGVKEFAPDDQYIIVGAGTRLDELQTMLARDKKFIPLASPYRDATMGGIVAANINAPLRVRYGSVRDVVLALTVALGDGRVIRAGRPVVKNVAGYDLAKAFIGSFGTLGLITEVTLKVASHPRARRTLVAPMDDFSRGVAWGVQLLPRALSASSVVLTNARVEGVTSRFALAYTAEGLREDVDAELEQVRETLRANGATALIENASLSGTDIWASALANALGESRGVIRAGVPAKAIAEFARTHSSALERDAFVVDIASGMVYAAPPAREIENARTQLTAFRQSAHALDGYAIAMSVPDEWRGALDVWGESPASLDVMRALKARWDPRGILNPDVFVV